MTGFFPRPWTPRGRRAVDICRGSHRKERRRAGTGRPLSRPGRVAVGGGSSHSALPTSPGLQPRECGLCPRCLRGARNRSAAGCVRSHQSTGSHDVTVRGAPGHHREGLCPHGSQDGKAWRSVTTRFGLEDAACRRAVLSLPGKSPPPLAREAHALRVCASKASRLREMT